jgi:hypothetical protein
MRIHDALVEALHPHSRFVSTLIVPAPPAAANLAGELLASRAHLSTGLGAVDDVDAEDEQLATIGAIETSRKSGQRFTRVPLCSRGRPIRTPAVEAPRRSKTEGNLHAESLVGHVRAALPRS